jgi:hypothetical protein
VGRDSGHEWAEVINLGTTAVSLHDWILDDGAPDAPIGATAYRIQSPTVTPGEAVVIEIPSGKFTMNNTGTETVRLFSPDKVLMDSVTYTGTKEGQSYARGADGTWHWGTPTPDEVNSAASSTSTLHVVINEVLPYPEKHDEEFIELLNTSDTPVNLTGYKLKSRNKTYAIPSQVLDKYLVIKRSESGIALSNKAKESLSLIDQSGAVVSALQYEDAVRGESLARKDDGDYDWTTTVTPGAANVFGAGKVSGATLVRTGNPNPEADPVYSYFAVFVAIWYIGYKLTQSESTSLDY